MFVLDWRGDGLPADERARAGRGWVQASMVARTHDATRAWKPSAGKEPSTDTSAMVTAKVAGGCPKSTSVAGSPVRRLPPRFRATRAAADVWTAAMPSSAKTLTRLHCTGSIAGAERDGC